MTGVHYELVFGSAGNLAHGTLSFVIYGHARDAIDAWGEKLAWNSSHQKPPTKRALQSLNSAPVADYLLADQGALPLDFAEVRAVKPRDGPELYTSTYVLPPRAATPKSVEANLETDEVGTRPTIYLLKISETHRSGWQNDWRETVLCRATSARQAAQLWAQQSLREAGRVQPAALRPAFYFRAVGEPLFPSRRKN